MLAVNRTYLPRLVRLGEESPAPPSEPSMSKTQIALITFIVGAVIGALYGQHVGQ